MGDGVGGKRRLSRWRRRRGGQRRGATTGSQSTTGSSGIGRDVKLPRRGSASSFASGGGASASASPEADVPDESPAPVTKLALIAPRREVRRSLRQRFSLRGRAERTAYRSGGRRRVDSDKTTAGGMPGSGGLKMASVLRLGDYIQGVQGDGLPWERLENLKNVRRLLSVETGPPISDVIATGVVPTIISMLERYDEPELQLEAAWVVTNIAAGSSSETAAVVDAISPLVDLTRNGDVKARMQAVWALGNVAGESVALRDAVLAEGALVTLLKHNVLNPSILLDASVNFLRDMAWMVSNLCRGRPAPAPEHVELALQTIGHLASARDTFVVTDALWALCFLLNPAKRDVARRVMEVPGLADTVLQRLEHPAVHVQQVAAKILCALLNEGSEANVQSLVQRGVVRRLRPLMESPRPASRRECTEALAGVVARGGEVRVQELLDSGVVEVVLRFLRRVESVGVAQAAALLVARCVDLGNVQQRRRVADMDCAAMFLFCVSIMPLNDELQLAGLSALLDLLPFFDVGAVRDKDSLLIDRLEELALDEGFDMQREAVHALQEIDPRRARQASASY